MRQVSSRRNLHVDQTRYCTSMSIDSTYWVPQYYERKRAHFSASAEPEGLACAAPVCSALYGRESRKSAGRGSTTAMLMNSSQNQCDHEIAVAGIGRYMQVLINGEIVEVRSRITRSSSNALAAGRDSHSERQEHLGGKSGESGDRLQCCRSYLQGTSLRGRAVTSHGGSRFAVAI